MAKKVLTHNLSEPLQGAQAATYDIRTGTGNLTINRLASSDGLLASGELEYLEKQNQPTCIVEARSGKAALTLKADGGRQPGFRLPWAACNGETNWMIHLNPDVATDLTAYTGGGNLQINLADMVITRVLADSGGGNLDMTLPDGATDLNVTARTGGGRVTIELGNGMTGHNILAARSGAGNVVVRLPAGVAALIHASTGMGKLIVDSKFTQIDKGTYQSADYQNATDRIEIDASSGAGSVSILTK
jgi:hypothetical protein